MNVLHYMKNKKRLLSIAESIISNYEKDEFFSCKDEVMKSISDFVNNSKEQVSEWQDYNTDYIFIAHKLILSICQSVLNNRDRFSLMLNRDAYLSLRHRVVDWAVKNGHIPESERRDYE